MNTDRQGNRLPDFLIVGAAKSGTTALYHYLREHPRIFMPEKKEPHYLGMCKAPTAAGTGDYAIGRSAHSYEDYTELFRSAGEDVMAGEASVSYLPLSTETIDRIGEIYDDRSSVKIIAVLRDPCERAISHYGMKVRDGKEDRSLREALSPSLIRERLAAGYDITWDYLRLGQYADDLRNYMRAFANVLVVDYAEFSARPALVLRQVFDFLGVENDLVSATVAERRYNVSGVPRHPALRPLAYLAYHQNPAKSLLARILPKPLKVKLQNRVGSLILKRSTPDADVMAELRQFYAENQARVRDLTGELDSRRNAA